MQEMFAQSPAVPHDPTVGQYIMCYPRYPLPLEYSGWQDETMAWKETCAIFTGLYPVNPVAKVTGPDVIKLLSYATTANYSKFPIGKLKHTMMCDDEGRILTHGLVVRVGEEEFHTYTLTPWLNYVAAQGKYDVTFEDRTLTEFNFQCTGPRILEVLEAATGDDLHDIPFLGHRTSSISGKEVRIFRVGMAGTLGYEVHGNIDDARELHAKIIQVGEPFGIRRMGWLTYAAQLPEGGFPQEAYTFYTASMQDKGFIQFLQQIGLNTDIWPGHPVFVGSSGSDLTKHFRNPLEVGWQRSISFEHEFRGKAALQKEAANPTRKMVTLLWNAEDVMDVYASLFRKGEEPYRFMEFPIEPVFKTSKAGIRHYQDEVLKDGKPVGYSNGRVYSLYSRDMSSMGTINAEYAELGTELTILWGEPGTRQKEIRAVVSRYPHLDLPSNSNFNIESIPRIDKKAFAAAST